MSTVDLDVKLARSNRKCGFLQTFTLLGLIIQGQKVVQVVNNQTNPGTADAEIKPLPLPLWETRAINISLSKPVVGPNIAFHAVPAYMASRCLYVVSAFPAHLVSFSPDFSNPQR